MMMPDTATLHLFTDGTDTVTAADVEDAWAVWCETIGEKREDYPDTEWSQVPDDQPFLIVMDLDDHPEYKGYPLSGRYDNHANVTKPAAEWAAQGRGFLCSTEW
jgi:hypothetical protein